MSSESRANELLVGQQAVIASMLEPTPYVTAGPFQVNAILWKGEFKWWVKQDVFVDSKVFPTWRGGRGERWNTSLAGAGASLEDALVEQLYGPNGFKTYLEAAVEEVRLDLEWGDSMVGKRIRFLKPYSVVANVAQKFKVPELRDEPLSSGYRPGYALLVDIAIGTCATIVARVPGAVTAEFEGSVVPPEVAETLKCYVPLRAIDQHQVWLPYNLWNSYFTRYAKIGGAVEAGERVHDPYYEVVEG